MGGTYWWAGWEEEDDDDDDEEGQERSLEEVEGAKAKEEKYNVTLSISGAGCEGIKGTFEEQEDDSESAGRVVSMITRSGEIFWVWAHESPPQASSETPAWL